MGGPADPGLDRRLAGLAAARSATGSARSRSAPRAGQVVVADSTTVLLYKLARAAVDARPGRRKVVLDTDNFPTDRYVLEGIAAERGLELVWIETDPVTGITAEPGRRGGRRGHRAGAVQPRRVPVGLAGRRRRDQPDRARRRGAGAVGPEPLGRLGRGASWTTGAWTWRSGCTYKYLNGGPGAPAFAYLRRELQGELRQPIWGWMGHRAAFEMGPGYEPAEGVRALLSGTPPILAMVPLHANLDLLAEAGHRRRYAPSRVLLTGYALELADALAGAAGGRGGQPARRRTGAADT